MGYAPVLGMAGPSMIMNPFAGVIADRMREQFGSCQFVFAAFGVSMLVSLFAALVLAESEAYIASQFQTL
jgi:Na+/melibiose symporter-like transporter